MSNLLLDEWQKEVLEYEGDLILKTGRQIGKTTTLAHKAGRYMAKHPGARIVIVSLSEDQAKLIIVMILTYLEKAYPQQIERGTKKPTLNKINLKNGSWALARPVGATGDAVRGFTGDVLIIDEASRMPEEVFTAAEPTLLSTGGQIWMSSTPAGKAGYFYEQYKASKDEEDIEKRNWKVFEMSSEEVIYNRPISYSWTEKDRVRAIKRLEKLKETWSSLRYGQEILGLFLDDLRRFFTDEWINNVCCLKRPEVPELRIKNYMGCDLARQGDDSSTFEIFASRQNIVDQVENITTKKTYTYETEKKILELGQKWNVRKVGIDAGAGTLGVSIMDHLSQTWIKHKLVAMNNRSLSLDPDGEEQQRLFKEDLYYNFLSMGEHGELRLLDDPEIRIQLASIQSDFKTTQGSITKERIFGRPSDIVEGMIRGAYLAKKEKSLNLWAY